MMDLGFDCDFGDRLYTCAEDGETPELQDEYL